MQPAGTDTILDNIRNRPREDFVIAAQDEFACNSLDEFLQLFLVHPKICADMWNNLDPLPEHAEPRELLAALLHLSRRQVWNNEGSQVRWSTPVQRSEEFIAPLVELCGMVSCKYGFIHSVQDSQIEKLI